jgi:hypothetical protein
MGKILSVAVVTVGILLAAVAPGQAQGMGGRGGGDDRHHEGGGAHDGRGRDGDHDRDGRHRGPFFGGPFVYVNPYPYYPYYSSPTPGYWYYCPSAEAYYPYVTNCLEDWVPVPAQ